MYAIWNIMSPKYFLHNTVAHRVCKRCNIQQCSLIHSVRTRMGSSPHESRVALKVVAQFPFATLKAFVCCSWTERIVVTSLVLSIRCTVSAAIFVDEHGYKTCRVFPRQLCRLERELQDVAA